MWESAKKPLKVHSVMKSDGTRHFLVGGENDRKILELQNTYQQKVSKVVGEWAKKQSHVKTYDTTRNKNNKAEPDIHPIVTKTKSSRNPRVFPENLRPDHRPLTISTNNVLNSCEFGDDEPSLDFLKVKSPLNKDLRRCGHGGETLRLSRS